MKRARIVVLDNSLAVTGALVSGIRAAEYLRDSFEFIFLLPHGSQAAKVILGHGFEFRSLPMKELNRSPASWITYFPSLLINSWQFKKLVMETAPTLIIVNDFYNMLAPVSQWLGLRIPYIVYVRFMPSRFPAILRNTWLSIHRRKARAIVAVSRSVLNELDDKRGVHLIYDGVRSNEEPRVLSNEQTILCLANYTRGKGQDLALRSFASIASGFPSWTLRFVGGTLGLRKNEGYLEELKTLAIQLGCTSQVEFSGFREDVRSEYEKSSIAVNFSHSESFSLTTLDALYFGKPVIATECGGPTEIVTSECGILVPPGDLVAMATAMKELMSQPELRLKMGKYGQRRAAESFGPERTYAVLENLIMGIVTSHE